MNVLAITAAIIAFLAIVFAYGLLSWINKSEESTEKIRELSRHIMSGVRAFRKREWMTLIPVAAVICLLTGFAVNWAVAVLYAAGVIFSSLVGFFGLSASSRGSEKTAAAAGNSGIDKALKTSVRSGAVLGLTFMGFGLLGIGGVFVILGVHTPLWAAGFGMGAATTAFIGCTGGGIYKTASETAAVLLGKSEGELSCEGPDNPAAITGYGSAHIGAAGIARYHFTGYTGAVIAAIVLAFASKSIEPVFGYPFDLPAAAGSVYPLLISAAGIIATAAAVMFIREYGKADTGQIIKTCQYVSTGVVVVFSMIVSWIFFGNFNCAISAVIGMIAVSAAGKTARTYAFGSAKHLKKITEQSQAGYMIISEYGTGMLSVLWPMAFLAAGAAAASAYAGYYGIALAAVGAFSAAGMTVTADIYGSVADNADRITSIAKLTGENKTVTNQLNYAGRTFKPAGKGFATAAAALVLIALFLSYSALTGLKAVNLLKPAVLVGLIIGALIPILLSAVVMNSAGKSAARIMDEVSRQLLAKVGTKSADFQPDYVKCADEGAKVTFKGIVSPGLAALFVPLAGGMFLGTEVLGGLMAGMLISGVLISVIMNNTGGAWNHGGKQASADPLRDAAVSFIMVFLEFVFLTAVVFASAFLSAGSLV